MDHCFPASLANQITYVLTPDNALSPSFPPPAPVPFGTCLPHDHPSSAFKYSVDDILQIVLTSRKSWKTLKGKSEAVWPPYLEATMLKALQEYEPDDSRETRMLGRHPMRNRFISDYILNSTGKYRSAKQIGSRLQQLRDTPEGRKLIDALTRCYHHTRIDTDTCNDARQPTIWVPSSSPSASAISCDSSSTSSSDSPATPVSPIMPPFFPPKSRQPAESRMPVYIDILPQQPYLSSTSASASSRPSDPSVARLIRHIDPTVTFVSPSRVNGKSSYIVLLDGAPVHCEDTALEYVGPYFSSSTGQTSGDEPVLYNAPLVPKYWDVVCDAADPTLYTIVQDVYHVPDPVPNRANAPRPRPVLIFSAIYHFQYRVPADAGFTYSQPLVDVSSTGSFMTSGSMPANPPHATSYPMPTTFTVPTSEVARSPGEMEQNLFDEPFMLDVNFDQITFDDIVASMDNPDTFLM